MGCLLVGVSALLALVVPASIARTSLVGAYVVLALLAGAAVVAVLLYARRARPDGVATPSRASALGGIGLMTVVYGVAVAVIHIAR